VKPKALTKRRDFPIAEANRETVLLFLSLQTQWRVAPTERGLMWFGLDYVAVAALMRMKKTKGKARMIERLQMMEEAALSVLSGCALSDADLAWAKGGDA